MPIKQYKGTTPGRRGMSALTYEELTKKKKPEKRLIKTRKSKAGRNNQGRITIRERGGGHKRKFRNTDFKRTDKHNINGKVTAIEYDPNRSAFLMLVTYIDGDKRYHLAPKGVKVGSNVVCSEQTKVKPGNRMMIKNIPVGYSIYNVEITKGKGGQIVRSAGSSATLVSLESDLAQVKLPSNEVRFVEKECYASIGTVSNSDHGNIKIGKAGRNRWKGKRPHVRGKARNPCDHPHGGGEGCTPIGLKNPKTPWGMPALGLKTRKRKRYSNKWIVRTRKGKQLIKTD